MTHHASPDFRPKDSRFGMARLENSGYPVQPATSGFIEEVSHAPAGLPPIHKSASASVSAGTRDRQAFSISLFGRMLGADIVEAGARRVRLRLTVRSDLCRSDGAIENAALFALADMAVSLGLSLSQAGSGCRVLETKTHVFEAAAEGTVLLAETSPLHAGAGPSVWQTRISAGEKQIAFVLQTCLTGA